MDGMLIYGTIKRQDTADTMHHYYTRVIFYVRRIGLYLYKYRIYGTITIYILKGLDPVYHLI